MAYDWNMTEVRISPDSLPPWGATLGPALAMLLTRSVAMGVLTGKPVTRLDAAVVKRLATALQRHGIGANAGIILGPLAVEPATQLDDATQQRVADGLSRLSEALEASATPQTEWPTMRGVFGDEFLVDLLGIAASSMRRYASGERTTPDEVGARLHWLAMVVSDLAGAYNDFGIRRWFARPRSQLEGRSPRQTLDAGWRPEDAAAERLRALAAVLAGAQPLAA